MSDIRFSQAASAYSDAFKAAQNIISRSSSGESSGGASPIGGTSFSDFVSGALKEAANSGYQSESIAAKSLTGKADMTDVVTAMAAAEHSLNTVVAIRDKVINAYQDIIKMPI